jgi:hypothetical protein
MDGVVGGDGDDDVNERNQRSKRVRGNLSMPVVSSDSSINGDNAPSALAPPASRVSPSSTDVSAGVSSGPVIGSISAVAGSAMTGIAPATLGRLGSIVEDDEV